MLKLPHLLRLHAGGKMKSFFTILAALSLLPLVSANASTADNPDFLRKLANPGKYRVNTDLIESICGKNEMQHVADYDGSRGQPVEFVATHEQAVAALAEGTPDNSKKYCTGTLISENLFLTASHCVDTTITKEFAVFNYQKVRGASDVGPQEHVRILEVVEQSLGDLDFAIIKLEGQPGLKYGFTHINAADIETGHLLSIIQHPSGKVKMVDVGHRTGTRDDVYMTYGDIDTMPGSSGSGILDQNGALVGVHTNGGCMPTAGENAGVLMTEILKVSPTLKALAEQ